jgi:hypothetical protein
MTKINSIAFICLSFLLLTVISKSQNSILNKQVSVNFSPNNLRQLLDTITKQSTIQFQFSNNNIEVYSGKSKKITLKNRTIREVLDIVLQETGITYTVFQNQILLSKSTSQNKYIVSGFIREKGTKELIIGASVYIPNIKAGIITNSFGFYSITVPDMDSITLVFSCFGYTSITKRIKLPQPRQLDIELWQTAKYMQAIEITADRAPKISQSTQMSNIDIPTQHIKNTPGLFGETDVIKVLQLMPGIQKPNEISTGLFVRGGGADENLILIDDAIVYNPFHILGIYSLFNGDIFQSTQLTKGGFSSKYGGRLSSVLDLRTRDGDKEKFQVELAAGLISSKVVVEGPLVKDQSSFIISARKTYLDLYIQPLYRHLLPIKFIANFYDINTKVNYTLGENDRLFISGYIGRDKYGLIVPNIKFITDWGNTMASMRWNHLFNRRFFTNTSFIVSRYKYLDEQSFGTTSAKNQNIIYNNINDLQLKHDIDYYPSKKHYLKAGGTSTYHSFGIQRLNSTINNYANDTMLHSFESALYIEDEYQVLSSFKLNIGFRGTHFTTQQKNYFNLDPRISVRYNIRHDLAAKISYAEINQYVRLLSTTGLGNPKDIWIPVTRKWGPQKSKQIATGISKDFLEKNIALSVEGYYKSINNILNYREGSRINDIQNQSGSLDWEQLVIKGKGWSYGGEFLLQKKGNQFAGWIAYTLSWSQNKFDSLNFGKPFYTIFDRRHDVAMVGIYKIKRKKSNNDGITLSVSWIYSTGTAFTLPVSNYIVPIHELPGSPPNQFSSSVQEYSEKNTIRMPDYHRCDIGIQFHKTLKCGIRTWNISVYNVYNRKNPYSYTIESNDPTDINSTSTIWQTSILPIIPSVSYSIKFTHIGTKKMPTELIE